MQSFNLHYNLMPLSKVNVKVLSLPKYIIQKKPLDFRQAVSPIVLKISASYS